MNPVAIKLRAHHEMDWLALRIAKASNFWPPDEKTLEGDPGDSSDRLTWEILIDDNNIACVGSWGPRSPEPLSGPHSELDAEKAQYALNMRRRLGQLTNWTGPASTLSIAVADSIEIVLNTLFKETDHSAFTWSLKVNLKIGDTSGHGKIHFKVGKNNGTWEMDATHIEAALSLWLFHIHETKETSENEGSASDWLRKDKSLKRKIGRLLGPGGSEALLRDIKWWIGDVGDMIHKDKSNEGSNVRRGSEFAGPVGFVGVEPVGTTEAGGKVDNKTPGKYHSSRNVIIEQKRNNSNLTFIGSLTVMSNISLESALAQHVFSSFMWAIVKDDLAEKDDHLAKKLDKGETSIVRGDLFQMNDPDTLRSFGLENKLLARIANSIQQTGLGSFQEAYMCIIPPLSCSRRLPMEAVVEFIRQRTREHERLGRWERVIPVYTKLLQECKTSGTPPSISQKTVAILIHLFLSVSNALQLHKSQERTGGVWELEKAKKKALKELNNLRDSDSLPGLIQSFKELYKLKRQKCQDLDLLEKSERQPASTGPPGSLLSRPSILSEIMTIEGYRLTRSNADVGARDVFGWTPLHYAAVRGDEPVMTKLLGLSADPNASDLAGWTPLHYSIENVNKEEPQSIVSALLRSGADTEIRGRDGMGPLHCAAKQGYAQVIRILIQAGASVDIQDNSRKTPLHWAAYVGSVVGINTLLEKGAYAGARDDYGRTPLHLAAVAGWKKAVEKLMRVREVERDSIDRDGRIPLHLAAIKGSEEVMRSLLDKNQSAVINTTDDYKCTPLDLAIVYGHENAAKMLSMYNTENNPPKLIPFGIAIMFGRISMVKLWVAGFDKRVLESAIIFTQEL